MVENRTLFLLGAIDPEMNWIANVLHNAGLRYQFANFEGKHVVPGTAYRADTVNVSSDSGINAYDTVVCVECMPKSFRFFSKSPHIVVVDHHRLGDPGYYIGPDKGDDWYWYGSSIGQLVELIKAEYPAAYKRLGLVTNEPLRKTLRLVAAMDHCYAAARRGECVGVSPQNVEQLQMRNIWEATGLTQPQIHGRMAYFRQALDRTDCKVMAGDLVRDLCVFPIGPGYDAEYLCMREAAIEKGTPYLCRYREEAERGEKIVLGNASPAAVKYFMTQWAPANKLMQVYGVPKRGYAGGYLPMQNRT